MGISFNFGETQENAPRKRGRPKFQPLDFWEDWNSLTWVLEADWADIAWSLKRLRSQPRKPTYEELVLAFEPFRGRYNSERLLYHLRTPGDAANAKTIRETKQVLRKARLKHEGLQSVLNEHVERCREAIRAIEGTIVEAAEARTRAEHATALAKQEIAEVATVETVRRVLRAYRPCETAKAEFDAIQLMLEQQEANYFQREILRFLRDHRFKLTPRNLAAAIEGLPWMNYRQSIKMCLEAEARSKSKWTPHTHYRLCLFLEHNWRKAETLKGDALLGFFQARIKKLLKKDDLRAYLAKNWAHLKKAILDASNSKCIRGDRPFLIARLFEKYRAACTTDIDRILADKESLRDV